MKIMEEKKRTRKRERTGIKKQTWRGRDIKVKERAYKKKIGKTK